MHLRNFARRLDRLERNASRNHETRLGDLMTRAGQIAARTKQTFDAAVFIAVEQFGTPLTIGDVDSILACSK